MTKPDRDLKIESEIGQNIARAILEKAKERALYLSQGFFGGFCPNSSSFLGQTKNIRIIKLSDLEKICSEPLELVSGEEAFNAAREFYSATNSGEILNMRRLPNPSHLLHYPTFQHYLEKKKEIK